MEHVSKALQKSDAVLKLISDSLALEAEDARQAGALGFMARALVQATMPHSRPAENYFERTNGAFTLTMMAPPKIGLPYGNVPRLLLAWLTTEAVRTQARDLVLGDSLSGFMRQLGMVPTGGRWGSITRLRAQSQRLFTSTISCLYQSKEANTEAEIGFRITDKHVLWWTPKSPDQPALFESVVTLSQPFFQEVIEHPVPIDLRALRTLSRSPLALDIYVWLTHRMSYLRRDTVIPWPALEAQFGADYARLVDFKIYFKAQLRNVLQVYPEAKVEAAGQGLILRPSPPHVRRLVIPGA
jgi:hypothetical protein